MTSLNNQEILNCLLCDSSQLKPLVRFKNDHLVKCKKCKFVFSNLKPTKDELDAVYSNYKRGESDITQASIEKLHEKAKYLLKNRNINSVLDVACGDGHFLDVFSQNGIQTYGTEFDSESERIAESKGVLMLEGGLLPVLPDNMLGVDLIIFTEVIEHINYPHEVLTHFFNIMNPGALLYITTPNFNSLERIMLGSDWGMIMYPEHVSYYTPDTLDKILKLNGFAKIKNHSENISVYRVMQYFMNKFPSKKFNPENISANAQAVVSGNKILGMVKSFINIILSLSDKGSSVIAVYKKESFLGQEIL